MRNLYRQSQSKFSWDAGTPFGASTIDQATGCWLYFSNKDGLSRLRIATDDTQPEPGEDGEMEMEVGSVELLLPADAGFQDIIAIEHLVLSNELCCAASSGTVWRYQLATGVSEEVTHCQNGILAMGWSPDQEVVVFVDGTLNVVTMIGSAYEPIAEVQLKDDTFGDRQFMSVGWGKKETQFHGSEGKAAAKKARHDEEEECEAHGEQSAKMVDISWRGDGELFAVNFLAPFGSRAFKVFNKEGALQFTSERCTGLESMLAWRPSGNWIAIPQVQQRGEVYTIALFEKNGLRHREIPLALKPRDNEGAAQIAWSPDSDVLAVVWASDNLAGTFIDLYVMGNYHWYLKQSIRYEEREIFAMHWDQRFTAGKTLHIVSESVGESDGELEYERIRFDFRIDRSVGAGPDDEAMVAVIDGRRLLLSNFRRAVIPPPMCGYTVEQEYPINVAGFIRSPGRWVANGVEISCNAFFTVDARKEVTLYDVVFDEAPAGETKRSVLRGVRVLLKIDAIPYPYDCTRLHWLWLNPDHMLLSDGWNCSVLYLDPTGGRMKLNEEEIEHNNSLLNDISIGLDQLKHRDIICIEASSPETVLVELADGSLIEIGLFPVGTGNYRKQLVPRPLATLPEPCEQLFAVPSNAAETSCVYAFTPKRRNLYRNGKLLAPEVTSALLTNSYLLFTTISELKFVPLAGTGETIVGDRRVERGSKLVTVVPGASRTIFQLPRGNLEAINPRVLSLCLIAQHLEALEYHPAFDIMRKERINLNLLVDHDPIRFMTHLGTHFLPQITNVNWLNLFISDLAPQDVCRTMYGSNYPDRCGAQQDASTPVLPNGYTLEQKVPFICSRLLEAMDADPAIHTQPKITCFVKQGQLEQALALIWTLKNERKLDDAADEALRYLLYLVEVNVLYDVALGMYDFGLVLFVATKSQKDPKEYLPFLNELKRMDEDYRKYRIDCHLKRYDRALPHIARYETDDARFEEALALIVTHNLYSIALECYRDRNEQYYRTICERYADHLRKTGKQADASLMYERANNVQQAIASARHALDWRRCIRLSARQAPEDVARILRSLIPALLEAGEFEGAATVAKEQLRDDRLAVECLLKDHRYEQALQTIGSAGDELEQSLQEMVRSGLREYLKTFAASIVAKKELFLRHKNRLAVVREERVKAAQRMVEGADDGDVEMDCGDCDLFSDSSTIASSRHTGSSGRSSKSHRSAKNRRKHERKLLNLKEGNQYEDIALVDALYSLVHGVCNVDRQRHVRSTCQVAIELNYDAEARLVQREYDALFQLVRYSLDAIWIPEMIVPELPPDHGQQENGVEPPQTSAILSPADLVQSQNAQRYALIKPHQRFKPDIQTIAWQWDILK
ncbi:elongator complex protein 1 [Anopheles darlingi]|uniref:elongator complex protein 1 n=1 Tax=Anopheles darlingi TaxID=43151 RepID=UPI0021003A7C|nr:elongator complex protein 1 [Anopheles darlingi]